MSLHERIGAVLERLATGQSVTRTRRLEAERTSRLGATSERDAALEARVAELEEAAKALWKDLGIR